MSEQNNQNKNKVRIDFPPKWVTAEKANGEPYTISNGKGDSWPAVKCTLPTGTKVDGKDLSGFSFTTFQKPWNKADIEAGKGTGVFVNADRNVSLFKYDQDGQRHDESVEPQKLSDAVVCVSPNSVSDIMTVKDAFQKENIQKLYKMSAEEYTFLFGEKEPPKFEHYIRSGQKLLRCGYTTGTCAALGAAGAARLLFTD